MKSTIICHGWGHVERDQDSFPRIAANKPAASWCATALQALARSISPRQLRTGPFCAGEFARRRRRRTSPHSSTEGSPQIAAYATLHSTNIGSSAPCISTPRATPPATSLHHEPSMPWHSMLVTCAFLREGAGGESAGVADDAVVIRWWCGDVNYHLKPSTTSTASTASASR